MIFVFYIYTSHSTLLLPRLHISVGGNNCTSYILHSSFLKGNLVFWLGAWRFYQGISIPRGGMQPILLFTCLPAKLSLTFFFSLFDVIYSKAKLRRIGKRKKAYENLAGRLIENWHWMQGKPVSWLRYPRIARDLLKLSWVVQMWHMIVILDVTFFILKYVENFLIYTTHTNKISS